MRPKGMNERVRQLRKDSTGAEKVFWEMVRARRFNGLKFRRQHPIGSYIVDFFCLEKRLIVEIDGSVHDQALEKNDHERQQALESQGFRVLRFSNEEVMGLRENLLKGLE
jgi:very-short-patch-repair endonuclease